MRLLFATAVFIVALTYLSLSQFTPEEDVNAIEAQAERQASIALGQAAAVGGTDATTGGGLSAVETATKLKECKIAQPAAAQAAKGAKAKAKACTDGLKSIMASSQLEETRAAGSTKARERVMQDLLNKFNIEREANANLQREKGMVYRAVRACVEDKKTAKAETQVLIDGYMNRVRILKSSHNENVLDAVRKAKDEATKEALKVSSNPC